MDTLVLSAFQEVFTRVEPTLNDAIYVILNPAELKTIKGTVKIDSKLTIAVKLTDKATSPSANLVKIFDVTPPGDAAIIIAPKAISIGSEII